MTRPDTWPFDKQLKDGERILWRQRQGRVAWFDFLLISISILPIAFFGYIALPSITRLLEDLTPWGWGWFYLFVYALIVGVWALFILKYVLGVPRLFFNHYALTDQRFLIANTFLFRTVRSLPPRWFHADLVYYRHDKNPSDVVVPCLHLHTFGEEYTPHFTREYKKEKALHNNLRGYVRWNFYCHACYWGNVRLKGIHDPDRVVSLIKTTLCPQQKADQEAWEKANPDYG